MCGDAEAFLKSMAEVFHSLFHRRPLGATQDSTSLQGNICEFCVWELGSEHWRLYGKGFSWPANARKPWRPHSDTGVDIIAVDENADNVYIIEVKSTKTGGSSYVDGDGSSLKQDFQHLFGKSNTAPENRIWGSIDEAVSGLTIDGHPELAEKVKASVGRNPSTSGGIRLIGTLVCKKGQNLRSHKSRKEHFKTLRDWLLNEGWLSEQVEFRTVELDDFEAWYHDFLREVAEQ